MKQRNQSNCNLVPTYRVWNSMRQRCFNPKNPRYKYYGGRGITVCERWMQFSTFLSDMGPKPVGLTLERKNNNAEYSPNNCIWATQKVQANNRTSSKFLEFHGVRMTQAMWADKLGFDQKLLHSRLQRWPIEKAFNTPKRKWSKQSVLEYNI